MAKLNTTGLSPMQLGRLNKELDRLYSFADGVWTLRFAIEKIAIVSKSERDGMIKYNRNHFNRLGSNREQELYMARLKATRLYFVNDIQVPKIVYDAVVP